MVELIGRIRPVWPAVRFCLSLFLVLRLAMFAIGVMTYSLIDLHTAIGVPGWSLAAPSPGWHNAITGWEHSDTLWFLRIGSTGYRADDQSAAFFPLYPSAIHVVGTALGGHWLLAAFLVSNVSLLVGLVLLYRLTAAEQGEDRARGSVLYLCLFPTALFLFAPYSESVFLVLAVGSIAAARRRHWLVAGALGAAAALTRSIGVVLVLALLTEAVHQAVEARRLGSWRKRSTALAVLASGLPAIGTGSYLLWWQQQTGEWRRPLSQQSAWGRHFSWPWQTLYQGIRSAVRGIGHIGEGYFALDLLLVAVALVACGWVIARCRPVYGVYTAASLLFPMFAMWNGRPLMSDPRFLLPVFPVFWGLAAFAERWRAHTAVVAVSSGLLVLLSVLAVASYSIF